MSVLSSKPQSYWLHEASAILNSIHGIGMTTLPDRSTNQVEMLLGLKLQLPNSSATACRV